MDETTKTLLGSIRVELLTYNGEAVLNWKKFVSKEDIKLSIYPVEYSTDIGGVMVKIIFVPNGGE